MLIPQEHEIRMSDLLVFMASSSDEVEVPVAAVVFDQELNKVAESTNQRERSIDPTAHAEIVTLRNAATSLGRWNLTGCSMYVTLEPCLMCAGAILESKISRLFFGAFDTKKSLNFSINEIFIESGQKIEVIGGVLEKECRLVMSNWFEHLRQKRGNI
jgi:tRNA(adenine34) deaminase